MKLTIFLIMITCLTLDASAQEVFTLQESVDYTLLHHSSVQIYNNNISIAEAKSTESLSTYLPQVSGSASLVDNLKLQTTILPAGIFGPDPKAVQFGTKYSNTVNLDVSQTIFDASKLVAIKANKPYKEMISLQRDQNKETLMYNTANAYFQVLVYNEQLRILAANKDKYMQMLKVLQYQYDKGTVLEKDVDRVKVNLSTTNYQIEDAITKEQLAVNTLKNTMGIPLERAIAVADTINYELFATPMIGDSLELTQLTDVKLMEQQLVLESFNVKTKEVAFLPSLSAVGKMGAQALKNNFSDSFSGWNQFSYIGISLNIPLFTGLKRSSQFEQEKLNLKNQQLNFQLSKENLKLQFDNAKAAVNTTYTSFKSNKDNMDLANKILGVTEYQYKRGVANLTDYLNDDSAYKNAQGNYLSSLYNLMISQLNYYKSQGRLSEFIQQIK